MLYVSFFSTQPRVEWNRTWGPGFSSVQGMDIVYSPVEARWHFQLSEIQIQIQIQTQIQIQIQIKIRIQIQIQIQIQAMENIMTY